MPEKLMSAPVTSPVLEPGGAVAAEPDWIVIVYDNETNTYEEVMVILMLATGCGEEEAYVEAWEVDHYGKCVVHRAAGDECRTVAEVVATIGIRAEALPGD